MFLPQITALSILLSTGLGAVATRHYNIVNHCPSSIDLFINGESQGALAAGVTTTRDFPSSWSGFIYTTSNSGRSDGSHTTRAGFFGEENYYYIVIDPDFFNTAVSITPINKAPVGGFCLTDQCDSITCSTALTSPPTRFPPPVAGVPPKNPLYECPDQNAGYTVTFCPSGSFPSANPPRTVHPGADPSKCLDVRGAVYANGTPVQIFDCNGTGAQQWVLSRGSTKVKVAGKNFCLDAGSSPTNGVGMKIWQCFDNLPAQQWFYTGDNRIALEGKGLCLDLTNGVNVNSNQLQTWQCTDGNNNQLWYW